MPHVYRPNGTLDSMRTITTTITNEPPPGLAPDLDDLLVEAPNTPRTADCDIKRTFDDLRPKNTEISTSASGARLKSGRAPSLYVKHRHRPQPSKASRHWHLTASGKPRRRYAGRPITRCITPEERREAYARWQHAEARATPFTRFMTVKPPTDHLDPVERIALWDQVRQRVRCWCRDCRIAATGERLECTMMTTRESDPRDSTGEHLHMLLHVPEEFQADFDRLAPGWWPNTHVRATNHREEVLPSGKVRSGFTYTYKAASPQARRRDRSIWSRPSGAILGERTWSTRNLHAKAREAHEAEVAVIERARARIKEDRALISLAAWRRSRERTIKNHSEAAV